MLLLLTTATAASGHASTTTTSAIGSMRRRSAVGVSASIALLGRQRNAAAAVAFLGESSLRWRTTTTTETRASTVFSAKGVEYKNQRQQPRLGIISSTQQGHHLMAAATNDNHGEDLLSPDRRNFSSAPARHREIISNMNVVRSSSRMIPPSYDALLEEEGFGGYDYVPDIYDMQDNTTAASSLKDDDATVVLLQQPISLDEFFVAARPPTTRSIAATATKTVAINEQLFKKKKQQQQPSHPSSSSSPPVVVSGGTSGGAHEPHPVVSVADDHRLPSIFDMMSIPVSAADENSGSSDSGLEYGMSSSTVWEVEETTRELMDDEGLPLQEEEEQQHYADGDDGREKESSPDITAATTTSSATRRTTATTRRNVPPPPPPTARPNWIENEVERSNFLRKASTGLGVSTDLEVAQERLKSIALQIYQQNNGQEFNIQSPRQVAKVLFGSSASGRGLSTNKEVLEGMAASGGNRMADLILQHRATLAEVKRQQRRVDTQDKRVRSASAVMRPATTTTTTTTSAMTTTTTGARTNSSIANTTNTSNENSTGGVAVVMEELDTDPLILVDASAYIFRAYYSMPPIHRSDGMPTGAVMGFCNMLNRLVVNRALRGEQARLVLVFDPSKGTTFRHELYSEYKGHRPSVPMDLIPQFPLIRHAAVAYGICQLEAPSFEADDVIATLATMAIKEGIDANILSSDKDLMQLVTDKDVVPSINMIDPMTMARVTYDDVVEKWGVPPQRLGDLLALAGDASDNVPGVPGIGPKIAAMLLDEFSTLDNLLDNVDNVKQKTRREKLQQHTDMARLSRKLVDLRRNVPLDAMTFPDGVDLVAHLLIQEFNPDRILAFYDQMGFRDLKRRFQNQLQRGQRPSSSASFTPRSKSSYGNKKEKTEIPKPEDYADVPF
jgi:5'-3' exonuclease